jgi:hypothetical protein
MIEYFRLNIEYLRSASGGEQIATKAPRHKAKPLVNIHLCVFVSWWRKCFGEQGVIEN